MPQLFLVPQFIETEDKIFGPISTRQFVILLVGGVTIFICFRLFVLWLFIPVGLFLLATIVVFAFVKVNGQTFHYFLINLIQTLKNPRTRIWQKAFEEIMKKSKKEKGKVEPEIRRKPLTSSRLTELSLVVDTGGAYKELEKTENK